MQKDNNRNQDELQKVPVNGIEKPITTSNTNIVSFGTEFGHISFERPITDEPTNHEITPPIKPKNYVGSVPTYCAAVRLTFGLLN